MSQTGPGLSSAIVVGLNVAFIVCTESMLGRSLCVLQASVPLSIFLIPSLTHLSLQLLFGLILHVYLYAQIVIVYVETNDGFIRINSYN